MVAAFQLPRNSKRKSPTPLTQTPMKYNVLTSPRPRTRMRYKLIFSLLLVIFAFSAVAQDKAALPTEDTVNAFMQHMFGYDSNLTWKILEIKPSSVSGLSEVSVL